MPSHALVTSSARTSDERKSYQKFLQQAVKLYSHKTAFADNRNTYNSTNNQQYDGYGGGINNNNNFGQNMDDPYYNNNYQQNDQNRYDTNRHFGINGNLDNSFTTDRNLYPGHQYGDNDLDQNSNGTQLYEHFEIFESERYGGRLNLMFQDSSRGLMPIREVDQSFSGYLQKSLDKILEIRYCPVKRMTICVTSDAEMEKCVKMRVSLLFIIFTLSFNFKT